MELDVLEVILILRSIFSDEFDVAALISPVGSNRDIGTGAHSYESTSLVSTSRPLACAAMTLE